MEQQANLQEVKTPIGALPAKETTPDVEVTIEYLPAVKPFHQQYPDNTTLGRVRTDAMTFFGVTDHQDRDTHQFFLEFNGKRLTNMAETLDQLLGPHRRGAHFNLVEQITPGSTV